MHAHHPLTRQGEINLAKNAGTSVEKFRRHAMSQIPFAWHFSALDFKTTTKGLSQQPMPNAIG
jgi:hypothetical protein